MNTNFSDNFDINTSDYFMKDELLGNIIIRRLEESEEIPYHLLLLADPSKRVIDGYLGKSEIYVGISDYGIVGIYVLQKLEQEAVEIKNIAVAVQYQGKGVGKLLLKNAADRAKMLGFKTLYIGTANSSIGQLYLYQKLGFEISGIKKDFFINHYDEPIFENGIQCKHMVVLAKILADE
jgi:ribosomal protein S18 acetylase RimI-like enzyme